MDLHEEVPQTKEVLKNIALVTIPAYLSVIPLYLLNIISLSYSGYLKAENEVAAVGMGIMYSNILFMSVCYGINSAICTFSS